MMHSTSESSPGGRNEPLVLALDTSTASLAAALTRGGETLAAVQSFAERNHSVLTVSQVKELLERTGVQPEQLDGIAVGQGPGSYTGMRIAVSVGKTLAWIWNKPLVGVSSLEALAFGAMRGEFASSRNSGGVPEAGAAALPQWFVPIMDARRGQVYTAAFVSEGDGGWERIVPDGVRLMEDWVDRLSEMSRGLDGRQAPDAIWLVGDLSQHEVQCERLRSLCLESGPLREINPVALAMEGESVALLGARRLAAGESDDVHSFVPNYTQLAEAEVKLLERKRQGRSESR